MNSFFTQTQNTTLVKAEYQDIILNTATHVTTFPAALFKHRKLFNVKREK
jgi:hypothetical protein